MSIYDIQLYENLPWQYSILFLMIGAALGSFSNVLALRWPSYQLAKNDSESVFWLSLRGYELKTLNSLKNAPLPRLMSGRSHCPNCQSQIPIYLNIPILSWLILKGKSACCKLRIDFRYLAFELTGAGVFLAIALSIGPSMSGLILGLLLMTLILAAVIDLKEGFIPDHLLFIGFGLSYLFSMSDHGIGAETAIHMHLLSFSTLFLIFYGLEKMRGGSGIGTADIHLIALSCSILGYLSYYLLPATIFFIGLTWAAFKVKLLTRGIFVKIIDRNAIPAGPAIVSSTILILFIKLCGFELA